MLHMWLLHCRLEMLDKVDAPSIHESYPLAVAYTALLDAVKSITIAVEDLQLPSSNAHCETVTTGVCLCPSISMCIVVCYYVCMCVSVCICVSIKCFYICALAYSDVNICIT